MRSGAMAFAVTSPSPSPSACEPRSLGGRQACGAGRRRRRGQSPAPPVRGGGAASIAAAQRSVADTDRRSLVRSAHRRAAGWWDRTGFIYVRRQSATRGWRGGSMRVAMARFCARWRRAISRWPGAASPVRRRARPGSGVERPAVMLCRYASSPYRARRTTRARTDNVSLKRGHVGAVTATSRA